MVFCQVHSFLTASDASNLERSSLVPRYKETICMEVSRGLFRKMDLRAGEKTERRSHSQSTVVGEWPDILGALNSMEEERDGL